MKFFVGVQCATSKNWLLDFSDDPAHVTLGYRPGRSNFLGQENFKISGHKIMQIRWKSTIKVI